MGLSQRFKPNYLRPLKRAQSFETGTKVWGQETEAAPTARLGSVSYGGWTESCGETCIERIANPRGPTAILTSPIRTTSPWCLYQGFDQGVTASVEGRIVGVSDRRFRGRRTLEVVVSDDAASMTLKWFEYLVVVSSSASRKGCGSRRAVV